MPARLSMLDRKLLRDLWEMKGQSLAIAAVIASGVTMFVAMLSNFDSLWRMRADFYERARFADVFAGLKRAPASLQPRLAAIPGVETVATRVVAEVTLDVPGMTAPASGRLVSLPEHGRPPLNDVYLRRGRWIDPTRPDEVLASEAFCEAHGFVPGDRVAAVINGRRRWLTIVGLALSPEFVYSIRPGELFPDNRRFGVFWMGRQALASAFDMEGGFNDVSIALARGASSADAIAALDQLVEPYGGRGAVPQSLQSSAFMLENELVQLRAMGSITPLVFFGVAAFILNVALTRALALQRPQIAALKALGYSNRQLAWHYIKWGLFIAGAGAGIGVIAGAALGSAMSRLYNEYFRFPILEYHVSPGVAVASMLASLVAAALGAQSAVRRAVRIPPAEAMRPEPPAKYRRSLLERSLRGIALTPATRMVVRNLERHPMRSLVTIVGIAFAVAILFVGLAFLDTIDTLIDQQFTVAMRQDATLAFVEPRSPRALAAVARLPGVMDVEPSRSVAVRLRAGPRSRTLAIMGLPAMPHLNRVVSRLGRPVWLPPDGLVLSTVLGEILDVAAGETVTVEVLEGARPVYDVPVAALVDDSTGLQAYMQVDAVRRLLREGGVVTGASVTLDPAQVDRFYAAVKLVPAVAGVALRDAMLENMRSMMAENLGLMFGFIVTFSGIIAFGVVYNSARVSLSERARELASLRVLGFRRAEVSLILLGELAVLTLAALPAGALIGYTLGSIIMGTMPREMYRLSFVATGATAAWAFLVVIAAAFVSGLVVRRRIDRFDLVAVLKTRE
jgi:putative ABC transport system permease protein